jgi:hypothetical protein
MLALLRVTIQSQRLSLNPGGGGLMKGLLPACPYRLLLVVGLFLALATPSALAENKEIADLRRAMEELKRAVEKLDERLKNLEYRLSEESAENPAKKEAAGQTVPAAPSRQSPQPQPKGLSKTQEQAIRDRWKDLRRGMTPQEVESVLGKPEQTMEVDRQIMWYYRYSGVGASVVFTPDGHVSGWQKPPFGLLW